MTPDRSAEIAQYLAGARGSPIAKMKAEVARRWPDLSAEEFRRAIGISDELLRSEAAEHFAEADALDELAAGRRQL